MDWCSVTEAFHIQTVVKNYFENMQFETNSNFAHQLLVIVNYLFSLYFIYYQDESAHHLKG